MEENYIEWLVKRKDPVYAWPVKILMIVVCALSVLAALQMLLGILILAAAARSFERTLSTSSPIYPASVSEVASVIARGT